MKCDALNLYNFQGRSEFFMLRNFENKKKDLVEWLLVLNQDGSDLGFDFAHPPDGSRSGIEPGLGSAPLRLRSGFSSPSEDERMDQDLFRRSNGVETRHRINKPRLLCLLPILNDQ